MNAFSYPAIALTGGGVGALDKIDGATLSDGDTATVIVQGDSCYFYVLDADSGLAESSPAVIKPDSNAGDKRWIQVGVSGAVAFATWQEIAAGVETGKACAPAQLEDSGVLAPPYAIAAEIIAGTVTNKTIAPDQLKAANIIPISFASATEIAAGIVANKVIAPDQLAASGAATGTGKVVRATSPVLVAPALGTPASGNLANCTDYPTAAILSAALAAAYPIGCIYTSTVATNPATVFGFGTWVAFGAGRVLLGNGGGYNAGETGGEATHTLTIAEMPNHAHSAQGTTAGPSLGQPPVNGNTGAALWPTTATGGGGAHNNLQPYIVVYFWTRTA